MAQGVGLPVVPGELARCAEEVARDLVALETDLERTGWSEGKLLLLSSVELLFQEKFILRLCW